MYKKKKDNKRDAKLFWRKKEERKMKKGLRMIGILGVCVLLLSACDGSQVSKEAGQTNLGEVTQKESVITDNYTEIKFSDMYETKGTEKNVSIKLQNLNGQKVKLRGYPAVQSPLDESFLYLNNQPYVTCPFCTIGDITKLEVIPVFMADGSKIQYTEDGLLVYGTLEVEAKVDSEGYTTQFRIYADKIENSPASNTDQEVQSYYSSLSNMGMIADIQNLQMNIEYASNPDYMTYYGETKRDIVKGIIDEYIGRDQNYAQNAGEEYTYLVYIKECPDIVKSCEPANNTKLQELNNELVTLYEEQIKVLEKYEKIAYQYANRDLTDAEVDAAYQDFVSLNADNLDLYNRFTAWNNKLRE